MGATKINMLDYTFQTWKVIAPSEKRISGNACWVCECQICGKQKILCGSEIRLGRTGQCRHNIKISNNEQYFKSETSTSNKIKNEIGNRYGKLIVQSFAYTKNSKAYWNCLCDCGKSAIVSGNHLRTGAVSSCGCLVSRKEEEIIQILDAHNIIYKREFSFSDLKDKRLLRFDFAIFDANNQLLGLIEYQGTQHYEYSHAFSNQGRLYVHDEMKKRYCIEHQIPLLELNKYSTLEEDILRWIKTINMPL